MVSLQDRIVMRLTTKLRDDAGSLITTMVFITVGFLITSLMTSWMITRIQIDYSTAQEAQIRSAIDNYAESILESVNVHGPSSVTACAPHAPETASCAANFPGLKAHVVITSWGLPQADGTIKAKLRGTAAVAHPVAQPVNSELTLTLAGVASYIGTEPTSGRPVWTKAGTGVDPTSLWGIAVD
jgi:hypothetical protein